LVSKAAIAPTAANIGAIRAPTAPTVKGNSATDSPSSFLIIILRAFPSFITYLIFSIISSPEILNSSFLLVIISPLIIFLFYYNMTTTQKVNEIV
jgi:hypothetical protein